MLSHIPPKGIKKKIIEKCYELIDRNEITEDISDKDLSEKVNNMKSKKDYILTPGNETSIMDYFRKGDTSIRE